MATVDGRTSSAFRRMSRAGSTCSRNSVAKDILSNLKRQSVTESQEARRQSMRFFDDK